jgi:acetyl esterase/lipase
VQDITELRPKRVVLTLPDMKEARVTKDVVYKTVDGVDLTMDVYRPADADPAQSLPAVVLVSGTGPWEMLREIKDWGVYVSYGELIAASGLVAVTFTHRSPGAPLSLNEVAEDVDDAVVHVRSEAGLLGIDADRLALWAFSGGPPFGLRTALRDRPSYIRCLVSYYGILDYRHVLDEVRLSSSEDPEEFSPASYLEDAARSFPPIFVMKAGQDHPGLNQSINRFVAAALASNVTLDLMTHPSGYHGFDVLNDDSRSREIIRRTLDFLEEHLTGAASEGPA